MLKKLLVWRNEDFEDLPNRRTLRFSLFLGELALLYNAPRAATIMALEDCTLFSLDRETFNNIVKDAAAKKREMYEEFLKKVEILESMDPYERMQIADALKPQKVSAGNYVFKQVMIIIGGPRRQLFLHCLWKGKSAQND